MHSASALDNAIQSRMRARSRHPPIVIREVQPLAVALSVVGICEAQRQVSLQVRHINEGVNILVLDEMRGDMKIARVASMIQQAMARPKHQLVVVKDGEGNTVNGRRTVGRVMNLPHRFRARNAALAVPAVPAVPAPLPALAAQAAE